MPKEIKNLIYYKNPRRKTPMLVLVVIFLVGFLLFTMSQKQNEPMIPLSLDKDRYQLQVPQSWGENYMFVSSEEAPYKDYIVFSGSNGETKAGVKILDNVSPRERYRDGHRYEKPRMMELKGEELYSKKTGVKNPKEWLYKAYLVEVVDNGVFNTVLLAVPEKNSEEMLMVWAVGRDAGREVLQKIAATIEWK